MFLGFYSDIKCDRISCSKEVVVMDIASLSMNMAQSKLLSNVGTAMLSKSINQAKMNGTAVEELLDSSAMERSVNPDIGANIDIRI
jgi:hypothetical protein